MESLVDLLYNLDGSSPPMLLSKGALRPAVRAALASQIMYYEERTLNDEMDLVCAKMRAVLTELRVARNPVDASGILVRWGKCIASQFKSDNLHLSSRAADTGSVQVVRSDARYMICRVPPPRVTPGWHGRAVQTASIKTRVESACGFST
jgi:hypothetical protein